MESHDHEIYYAATGTSEDDRKWSGTWVEMDGEFSEIADIEEDKL